MLEVLRPPTAAAFLSYASDSWEECPRRSAVGTGGISSTTIICVQHPAIATLVCDVSLRSAAYVGNPSQQDFQALFGSAAQSLGFSAV